MFVLTLEKYVEFYMLDTKKADLNKVMKNQWQNLTKERQKHLLNLLQKNEDFFGTWNTDPVDFDLKWNYKPICSRSYPLSTVHEELFKKLVEYLVLLGFLEKSNAQEWGSPYFAQTRFKNKSNTFSKWL